VTPTAQNPRPPSGGIFVYAPAAAAQAEVNAVETGPFPTVRGFDWTIGWDVREPNLARADGT
jgi:hypothetical protein